MPIPVKVIQTGLEASIETALQRAGRNAKIDIGVSAKSIGSLSQPLGKITGQADQFTRSMEAANARVLAFGASVGVLAAISKGFQEIITTTIKVEKSLANINSVLGANSSQLNKFKNDIFSIAKETGNSFDTVSEAALELSRQGLRSDEVLRRLKDSMILSRLSGLDATSAVEGLTAAVNSFSKEGVTTSEVLNKISKTAAGFAVSERDLIEGFKRSASVAQQAGVSLDELGGIITAVQQKTARGGAVIGNAFKTIFTRIQSGESLEALRNIGVAVDDAQGKLLPTTKLLEGLAVQMKGLSDIKQAEITEKIGGGFQIGPLIATLDDLTSKTSVFTKATIAMRDAGSEAYQRNTALNKTLAASINNTTVSLQELANTLGEIGVTDNLKNILSFFGSFLDDVKDVLQGEGLGSDFAKGLIKGISAVISGPGLLIFGAIIAKLTYNFIQFGTQALKTFFNIGNAAKEIGAIQSTIASTLLNNKDIQTQILSLEGNRTAQARAFSDALNTQLATMEKMRGIAASIAPDVFLATTGKKKKAGGSAGGYIPSSAGGYMPTVMAEANDIRKGVGGARPSDRPVVIPNFNFGGGKVGTMVANTGEHIIRNYGGSGGSAIFNRDMAKGGLPSSAEQIRSAAGFIPNFAAPKIKGDSQLDRAKINYNLLGEDERKILDLYYDKAKVVYYQNVGSSGDFSKLRKGLDAKNLGTDKQRDSIIATLEGQQTKRIEKIESDILNLNADLLGGIGVVSVSGPKNTDITESITGESLKGKALTSLDEMFGKGRYKKVTMSNIQVRSLDNLDNEFKRDQKSLRTLVKNSFIDPLYKVSEGLLPELFSGNDLSAQKAEFKKHNDPELFSDSVLGGIFESAVRVATRKTGDVVRAFSESDDNAPFDYQESSSPNGAFIKTFGFERKLLKADAKKTATEGTGKNISSVISKSLRDATIKSKIKNQYASKMAPTAIGPKKRSAFGYIPNFADALKDAISREAIAGVDISKIYVDQNDSLKGPMNPSGLMVANRRDEPSGGWQGINRARQEGINAKTYGSANGFVPNYAKKILTTDFSNPGSLGLVGDNGKSNLKELNKKIDELGKSVKKNEKTLDAATKELEDFIKTLKKASGANISASTAKKISGVASDQLTLKSNQRSPDLLGSIFAVQGVLTLLSGSTEGATNAFAKFTSALTGGLANVASAAFAYQGFSQIADNAQSGLGKFLGKAGAYGAIAAAAFSAIDALGDSWDVLTGTADKVVIGMEKIAKAAEQAAFQLSDYSKGEQSQITKRGTSLVEGATVRKNKFNQIEQQAAFEGLEFKGLKKSGNQKRLEAAASEALAAGVSFDLLYNSINKINLEIGYFSSETVDGLSESFAKLSKEANKGKTALSAYVSNKSNEGVKSLIEQSDESFSNILKNPYSFVPIRKVLEKEGITEKLAQDKALTEARGGYRATDDQKEQLNKNLSLGTEKALLDVLKKKLEISLEIRDLLLNAPSSAQRSLSVEKELNTTLESRKILIENQIEGNKRVVDLVSQQSKIVSSKLSEKSLEGQIFGSLDASQKIDKEEYKKVADITNNILNSVQKQGGWNKSIEEDLNNQLETLKTINDATALQLDARSKIVESISAEAYGLKDVAIVKNRILDLEQQSLAIAKATNFIDEQRKKNIVSRLSNRNTELEGESRLAKARQESRKLSIERSAIGGSNYEKSSSQAKILREEKFFLNEEASRASEKVLNDLQKTLLEKANAAKVSAVAFFDAFEEAKKEALKDKIITPKERTNLIGAASEFSKKIEQAGIEEAKKSLEASFAAKEAIIKASISTALAGEAFKSTIVTSAEEFSRIIKEIIPPKAVGIGSRITSAIGGFFEPSKKAIDRSAPVGAVSDLGRQLDELKKEKDALLEQFKTLPTNNTDEVLKAQIDSKVISLELANALDTASNSLLQLGADATTFNNLISNAFKNLKEEAAQNQFSLLGATSPDALISSGLERIKNTTLQAGPQTPETIKQVSNDMALLSKKLDYETAIGSATKSRLKFEYEQTLKILELKDQLLKATSPEETIDLLKKIKEASLDTEGLGSRISSLFNPTDQERKKLWEDSLISSSEKFRDNVIDGITTAIEQGGNLKDILQSAALDFAREMTKANLKNLFGTLLGGVSNVGSLVQNRASGGPITGGSGSKDDVPAMLMGGEYVMNKKAVQKYGSGFMSALNNGSISGYAKGGSVIRSGGLGSNLTSKDVKSQQTGEGGYYMPGYYDSGAITGKKNLLAYARQAYTSGEKDVISSGAGFSAINLSPESIRLTNFGRKQGPMADATRESKKEAFGLYIQQLAAEKQAKEEEEARKKAFKNSIKMALISVVASSALSAGASVVKSGFNEGLASVGKDAGFFEKLGSGFRGVGEKIGNVGSSLGSLFSGNFKAASQYAQMSTTNFQSGVGIPKALMINSGVSGVIGKSISNGIKSPATTYQGSEGDIGLPPLDFVDATGSGSGLSALAEKEIAKRKMYASILSNRGYSQADIRNIFQTRTNEQLTDLIFIKNPIIETTDPTKRATGGQIPSASGIDTVPAMLSGGEFIMNAGATQRIGANNLNAMNSGASINQTSSEGDPKLIAKLDELIKITKDSGKAVTVNVSSSEAKSGTDKQAADNGQQDQNLSRKIKAAVVQVLQEEKRLGGVLRRA